MTNNISLGALTGASKKENYYELKFSNASGRLYILASGIFRLWIDPSEQFSDNGLINNLSSDQVIFDLSTPRATGDALIINSDNYQLIFKQKSATFSIFDNSMRQLRFEQIAPLSFGSDCEQVLSQKNNEYFFGAGLQLGSYSHKGKKIHIGNNKIVGQGGVLSDVPFFWSTAGYGIITNTKASGEYDFSQADKITLAHRSETFDAIFLLANSPEAMMKQYYKVAGEPITLPKSALELGLISNYADTLWKPAVAQDRNADQLEDKNYYMRTKDASEASHKASLNGEESYQFSARAMLDRYAKLNFPLGWIVPDYQASQIDDQSMATFAEYANTHGIELGTWHDSNNANFLVNASESEFVSLVNRLNRKRTWLLTDHGDVSSQKYGAIIYGGATGDWELLRAQISGLISSNLSGQPYVGSAVDGISGGGNAQLAIRDLEWKAFTPLFFHINDQSRFSKTPFAYNAKMQRINRLYIGLREQLSSYLYNFMHLTKAGHPMIRPIFWEFSNNRANFTEHISQEFLLGSNILVAPIYSGRETEFGKTRKDNLYLPDERTLWTDMFTCKKYLGGSVYNQLEFELWHLPVFIKAGTILDIGKRNYIIYPQANGSLTTIDDDNYVDSTFAKTTINLTQTGADLNISVNKCEGTYPGMETQLPTSFTILADKIPDQVTVKIANAEIELNKFGNKEAFDRAKSGVFFNQNYQWINGLDQFNENGQFAIQIKLDAINISTQDIELDVKNCMTPVTNRNQITDALLAQPKTPKVEKVTAHSISIVWPKVTEQVQVEVNGLIYHGIAGEKYTFHELQPNTKYVMRLRYLSETKVSEWSAPFGAITKSRQEDYAISNIDVSCNYESLEDHPLSYLTDRILASEWQTKEAPTEEKPLDLIFNFKELTEFSRMVFIPRLIDNEGDPLRLEISISQDGQTFSNSHPIVWKADGKNKVIGLRDVSAKAIKLRVLESVGSSVSAREIMFFKAKA
ncbi:MAG: glycoside hydrolase family 31 protein [Lactobacillus sp.]|nr:glycoside hydrolase family 31 protein [Lactobacillus sp.]